MFQKVCQKRFQIELQNIHQIRCRKEGPNRMPDGMSEYMPDNMSAGGAHSKKKNWKNGPERPGFPKIIPIRPRYGPDTAPIRPRYGPDTVPILPKCSILLEQKKYFLRVLTQYVA